MSTCLSQRSINIFFGSLNIFSHLQWSAHKSQIPCFEVFKSPSATMTWWTSHKSRWFGENPRCTSSRGSVLAVAFWVVSWFMSSIHLKFHTFKNPSWSFIIHHSKNEKLRFWLRPQGVPWKHACLKASLKLQIRAMSHLHPCIQNATITVPSPLWGEWQKGDAVAIVQRLGNCHTVEENMSENISSLYWSSIQKKVNRMNNMFTCFMLIVALLARKKQAQSMTYLALNFGVNSV